MVPVEGSSEDSCDDKEDRYPSHVPGRQEWCSGQGTPFRVQCWSSVQAGACRLSKLFSVLGPLRHLLHLDHPAPSLPTKVSLLPSSHLLDAAATSYLFLASAYRLLSVSPGFCPCRNELWLSGSSLSNPRERLCGLSHWYPCWILVSCCAASEASGPPVGCLPLCQVHTFNSVCKGWLI